MFTPLSGVMAAQCDMADIAEMHVSTNSAVMPGSVMPAHDISDMLSTDMLSIDSMHSAMNQHDCCDDLSFNCSAGCDLGVNITLILQQTSYSPVYKYSFKSALISSKILFRELTPPSRPPANLHS
jgi:hypothetical protein